MKNIRKRAMKGLTLIEGLLFLGIAAVVIVAAVAFYNNASNTSRLNQVKTQVSAIGAGIQSLYATQASYATADTDMVINAGIAPSNTIANNEIRNPWGGLITITGSNRYFDIVLDEIPQQSCVNLLSSGMLQEGAVIRIRVNDATNFDADPNPADALTACSDPDVNSIAFRFR